MVSLVIRLVRVVIQLTQIYMKRSIKSIKIA